jgi:beta-N-acetylhexosaminidase
VVTDAMNMDSVAKNFSAAEATVLAFNAGNDLILFPPDEEIAIESLHSAVRHGEINEERIEYSLGKLLSAKRWLKIDRSRFSDLNNISKVVGSKKHFALAKTIAERSITLVKNEKRIVPIDKSKYETIFCITITEGLGNESEELFQSLIQEKFPNSMRTLVHEQTTDAYYNKILNAASGADLLILSSFIRVKAYQGTVSLSKKHETFIRKLLSMKVPTLLLSFGNPYLLSSFPKVNSYLCAFGDTKVSQQAMIKALVGEIDIQGTLPISIPGTRYKVGYGINQPSRIGQRLHQATLKVTKKINKS